MRLSDSRTIFKQDFQWAETGDFIVFGGDVKDTREIKGLGLIEEVELRIRSSFRDWALEPQKGANLDSYRGKPNTEATWEGIANSITYSLVEDSFLGMSDFKVYCAPVSHIEVAVRIDFSDNIKRNIDEKLHTLRLMYNLDGQGPFITR